MVDDNVTLTMEFEEIIPSLGYKVVGVAGTGKEGVDLARKFKPDLVLMDIRMPGEMDGIQAAARIKTEVGSGIIFVSGHSDEVLLDRAKILEPLGFLHKPFSEQQLVALLKIAFYQLRQNETFSKTGGEILSLYEDLTSAEIRIAQLVKIGKTTDEISETLKISPATVIWHRKNIRKKLGISGTRKELRKSLSTGRK